MTPQVVLLVYSTTHALQLEQLLAGHGLDCKLVPVPRHLSSDCGICVCIAGSDLASARALIAETGLEVDGVHEI